MLATHFTVMAFNVFLVDFSLQNALAAATVCRAFDIKPHLIARALEKMGDIPGRAQRIDAMDFGEDTRAVGT